MSEIKNSFPENVKEIYRLNIKKLDKELNTQYLKQNTSFTPSLKLVGMWEYFISDPAKDPEILLSCGARTCLIITVRDPKTKVSGMIHIPILEDEVKMNYGSEVDFSKFYDFAINQFETNF
jgi:chemotaxis receptor (MCP) glutamine deamidase CheD